VQDTLVGASEDEPGFLAQVPINVGDDSGGQVVDRLRS
jgi:hypothetical protein